MNVADYLNPDTSSQLKKSSEIFSEYLKAKQQAALAQAAKASIDANGNFDEKKYRTSAMMGGVSPADAHAGVKDAYEWQQRVAAEQAREAAIRRQSETLIDPNTGKPFVAGVGTVDTGRLALDPRLQQTNATALAMDAEQNRALQANQRAAQAAQSAQMATALGAPQGAGVGTPVPSATTTEQAILGGGAQQQEAYPKEMPGILDVRKLGPEEAGTLAYGLRAAGTYTDRDNIPGPNMQKAFQDYFAPQWQALQASEPRIINYGGDYAKFTKDHQEWAAKAAGFEAEARKTIAGWKDQRQAFETSRLGNASTRQGMTIAGTNFAQEQDAIQAARADGYKGVSAKNVGDFQKLQTDMNWLRNTSEGAADIIKEVNTTGNIDPTKFQALLKNLEQAPMAADKITDIGGREQLSSLFAARKDVQQVIRNSNTLGELAKNLAKNEFATDQQARVAQLIKDMVDHQMKHGNTASALEALRADRKPKGVNEKLKEKIVESVKSPKDVPVNQRKKGQKFRMADGSIGTWNGKDGFE